MSSKYKNSKKIIVLSLVGFVAFCSLSLFDNAYAVVDNPGGGETHGTTGVSGNTSTGTDTGSTGSSTSTGSTSSSGTSSSSTTSTTGCTVSDPQGSCGACSGSATVCVPANPDQALSTPACSQGNGCDLITKYVNPLINVLSGLIGVVAVISLIIGGIQYSTSAGDPQKAAKARARLIKTVVALIGFIFLYAFLQFIIPGGIG